MRKKSLTARTIRTSVIGSLLLGVIALLIGLSVYMSTMIQQYVFHAFDTVSHAWGSVKHGVDSFSLVREVMAIYRSLTPEQRNKMKTNPEEYRAYYASIDTEIGGGGTWDVLINMLDSFAVEVDDVYLGMYDEERNALIYFANADDSVIMYPGDWETVSRKEAHKFLNWDGTGMLYEVSWTPESGWICTAGYPIREGPGNKGELYEFLLADVAVDNVIRNIANFTVKVTLGILIVTGAMTWYIRRRIKKSVAEPIDAIANAAIAYTQGKKENAEGEYFSSLDIHTGDELENLSRVMADMEKNLTEHEEHIRTITAEKERINTELSMASKIQESMLPRDFPAFPDREEFDIYASMNPARVVGGDFYDFFLIDEDHLCVVMADVSGKGIPGALFMMVSKVILQSCAMLGQDAADILSKTNEALCSKNEMEMFVTAWVGILEISTGRLTAANAGHEYPALCRRDGRFALIKEKHGFVLGGMPEARYRKYDLQLNPGDKLFLYTDGVPEATDADNRMFGAERMLDALNTRPEGSPREILKNVRKAVDDFVRDAEQFDDLTMLCLTYKGKTEGAKASAEEAPDTEG